MVLITCKAGGRGFTPGGGGGCPSDIVLGGDPILEFGIRQVGDRCEVGGEMEKVAWVQGTLFTVVSTAATHQCELAWFGRMGEDGARVGHLDVLFPNGCEDRLAGRGLYSG